jgi:geranylgeranyl diphosphate synthase type I
VNAANLPPDRLLENRPDSVQKAKAVMRAALERALGPWLDERCERARSAGPEAYAVVDAVRELTVRGGKRFRATLVGIGYEACGGDGGPARVVLAGLAMELLQSYLLIHDDWMDGDDVRRGGPSVPAMLCDRLGGKIAGDHGAVLAGDFACALAQEALASVPVSGERTRDAMQILAGMQRDVILGQVRDLHDAPDVELTYRLKTGAYTVCGPLRIGAALAGAPAELREGLARFAEPLGIAFQLRDDLLGTFGDPKATGKPTLGDITRGKRTALVAALGDDEEARSLFAGAKSGDREAARALADRMIERGVKAKVERRLSDLCAEALARLADLAVDAKAKRVLESAVDALGERDR